ncbi:MAG: helix-turn-helix domain-containing protein [Thermoguttaceae bacterium]|jgi:excisionase family DNA binding protein
MNIQVASEYNEYLKLTGGDRVAAASLALAAALREFQPTGATEPADRALTVAEAADLLNISTKTVYDLVNRGELSHHRVGGRTIRFLRADIREYQRQKAEAARRCSAEARPDRL